MRPPTGACALEPCSDIDDVAGCDALARPGLGRELDHGLAGCDGYPHREVELLVLRELVDRLEDPQARAHGALGIVLVRHGRAEDGHHGVADELLDRAAVALDLASTRARGTGAAWHGRLRGRPGRRLP